MSHSDASITRFGQLPVILIAAVLQGWSLYALHISITHKSWPATEPGWLLAFYAVTAFIPLTLQLLASHASKRATWILLGALATLFLYFGWHHGARVIDPRGGSSSDPADAWIPIGFVLVVLWLIALPFIKARIAAGRWRVPYSVFFATAWNNKLLLAEAAAFTALFWLLLFLWQQLFRMIGIAFFYELFREPLFIYPVTSLVFGLALHLIGSLERFTNVVLDQVLNVLKWLAILAGLMLGIFTIALALKLPGLISSGDRVIGAAWLLWLIAVTVLLINAGYRDGTIANPYPRAIAFGLRIVVPFTIVIAVTALYALYLRIDTYGFTGARVWACVVATAATFYSVGYAASALRATPWMANIARINVAVALFLIVVLALTLTPVLSPYRIAASSQYARVLANTQKLQYERGSDPFHYLRFDAGRYGVERLRILSTLTEHPQADSIRADATAALALDQRWKYIAAPSTVDAVMNAIVIRPSQRTPDAALLAAVREELGQSSLNLEAQRPLIGVFIDMNGDQREEFMLIAGPGAVAFEQRDTWTRVARFNAARPVRPEDLSAADANLGIRTQSPAWKDLQFGELTFRFSTDEF